jgi:pimeloyl-ACP methyl ester carboxylesterase
MNEAKNGNEEIGIIGQSMGAMDALTATIMTENERPGTVKNIVLVDPAGMIGKDSMFRLGKRFMGQMKENVSVKEDENRPQSAKENVDLAAKEFFKYVKDNPRRAIKEIYAMTNLQIQNLLLKLKSQGIGISIIHGVDDLTFPMNKVQENTKGEQLDGFYSVQGGHNELYLNPEKYMALAEHALTALENKSKKHLSSI